MKTGKRILSLALALLLCLALLPQAMAAENAGSVAINKTNFPDDNFRKLVSNYDKDNNKKLSEEELGKVTRLDCSSKTISSLKGIEHFYALTGLSCPYNYITELDLSKNSELFMLDCSYNKLTSLVIGSDLMVLSCNDNKLKELDVSACPSLNGLYCGNNDIKALDVSGCPALNDLSCFGNPLKELDLSKNTELWHLICSDCQLSALDLSKNKELITVDCKKNWLTELDLRACTELSSVDCAGNNLSKLILHRDAPASQILTDEGVEVVRVGKPSAPENLAVNLNAKGKPVLSWGGVRSAEKYQVFRSLTGKSGSFKRIATVTGTSYTNTKAVAGTTYWYKVRVVADDGAKSAYSKVVKIKAQPGTPKLKSSHDEAGKPVLSWKAVAGAAKYQVWRSTTGAPGSFKLMITTTKTSWTDSKVGPGKGFFYIVRAITENGTKGAYCQALRVVAEPKSPVVTGALSQGRPKLSWKSAAGASSYEIWRSKTGEVGSFRRVASISGLSWVDTNAKAGQTYYYKVKSMTNGAKSDFSAVIKLTAE